MSSSLNSACLELISSRRVIRKIGVRIFEFTLYSKTLLYGKSHFDTHARTRPYKTVKYVEDIKQTNHTHRTQPSTELLDTLMPNLQYYRKNQPMLEYHVFIL